MTRAEIIKKLHQIRAQMYEEEKDLSIKEKVAKINREGEDAVRRLGFKFRRHTLTHS